MGYTSGRVGPLPEMYTLIGGDAEGFQKQFTAFSQEYLGLYCAYKKVLSTGKEEGENKKTVRARKVYQIGWPLSAVASEVRVLFFVFIIILKRDKNVNLINLTYLVGENPTGSPRSSLLLQSSQAANLRVSSPNPMPPLQLRLAPPMKPCRYYS